MQWGKIVINDINYLELFCMRYLSLLLNLLFYQSLCISVWTYECFFETLGYIFILCYFLLGQIVSALAFASSCICLLCAFDLLHPQIGFVCCFLVYQQAVIFWQYKILQAHLVYFLPQPRIRHFSKEVWLFLLEDSINLPF